MPFACGDHITKLLLAYNCKQAKRLASFLHHHDLYIIHREGVEGNDIAC